MGAHLLVIALGGTLALGLYHGYRGGLVRSAFKLLGLIAGVMLARPLAAALYPELSELLDFPGAWILLVVLAFLAITIVFALAGWLVSLLIRWTPLVWVDRIGGAGLGFLMGLLICAVILGLLEHLRVLDQLQAQARGWEEPFIAWIRAVAPDLFKELKEFVLPADVLGGSV